MHHQHKQKQEVIKTEKILYNIIFSRYPPIIKKQAVFKNTAVIN